MTMNFSKTLLAAGVFALIGGAANAAGVHIEDFGTGAPGQVPDPYINGGYSWTPVNPDNGAHCYGGLCLHEAGQQEILSNTDTHPDTDLAFDLLGFFVDMTGQGNDDGNFLTVTGELFGGGTVSMTLAIDDLMFADPTGSALIFDRDGNMLDMLIPHGGSANGAFVIIQDDYFDGLTSISWDALGSANVRLDCVALSMPTGQHSVSLSEMRNCDPEPNIIPLPAAGWLLIGSLGGLLALRRRKS